MSKLIKIITSIFFVVFANAAQAQNAETIELLLEQTNNMGQLKSQTSLSEANSGTPTAENSNTANALDASEDESIIVQSEDNVESKDSLMQQYYKILTDDLLEVFGAREFSQKQEEKLLFFNTFGKSYQLAPGDIIRVNRRGMSNSDSSYKIDNNGELILPDLQPIAVSGLAISELEQTLQAALEIDDASAEVFISLETARLITVQVSGAVNEPRTLAVPAYTPLSRVLAHAGGIKPNGSLRNIVLRDRDGSIEEVDFYKFLQSSEGFDDPVVKNASRIFVPDQGPTVAAFGFVARPGIYELPKGQSTISVKDLLTLSGTSIIPPGLLIEASFFDANGIWASKKLTLNDSISNGEVLNLNFVQTRQQDKITITGAVLEDYSITTSSEAISVFDVLKGGATLKPSAKLNFALIIERNGNTQAIDIEKALQNTQQSVPPGASLVVLDQSKYQELLNADPDTTNDQLVKDLAQAEFAELYLNGNRLALIAPDDTSSFSEILRGHYRTTSETNLNLAIIEAKNGVSQGVDLREVLNDTKIFSVTPGLKIHIFETTFLTNSLKNLTQTEDLTEIANPIRSERVLEQSGQLSNLFTRSNIVQVKLDGKLIAVLPDTSSQKISIILDIIGFGQSINNLADFIELELRATRNNPEFRALSIRENYRSELPAKRSISFWSNTGFEEHLSALDARGLNSLSEIGVSIFIDNELDSVMSPNSFLSDNSFASELIGDRNIYALFSIIEQNDKLTKNWVTKVKKPKDLFLSETVKNPIKVNAGDQISLFTRDFVRKLNVPTDTEDKTINSKDAPTVSELSVNKFQDFGSTDRLQEKGFMQSFDDETLMSETLKSKLISKAMGNDALLRSYSLTITGAVQRPGAYPISGDVELSELIQAAGGELASANTDKIAVQFLNNINGSTTIGRKLIVDIKTSNPTLNGNFFVNVPFLINEASTGIVSISGEVLYPGEYVIARDDTVHDLIEKAGGLSIVAYPLGAVYSRKSLQESERENNNLLATELEGSITQLATSTNPNAVDQTQILVGYANKLRSQPVTGRMPVNVILRNKNNPVYMQPGDTLVIPKRPSHVTVMGAVNRKVNVSYTPEKLIESYLFSAGGTTKLADLKKSYLLLPNGEALPIARKMPVPPGAVIVIVPRLDRLNALGLTELISRVLGNIATSVLAINNVR